jgi:predicted metallopeptidase
MFQKDDRVIVPIRGIIIKRRTNLQMELANRKRFDIEVRLPDDESTVIVKDYNTYEIQDYDCEVSEELRSLAERIIDRMPELYYIDEFIGRENICYITSYEPKGNQGKIIFADCRAVKGSYRALLDFRYIITFYEPNMCDFTANQRKILMLHELKHIQEDGKVRPHDVEDFASIIYKYGITWNSHGSDVPDILAGGDDEKNGTKRHKLETKRKTGNNGRTPSESRG